MWLQELPEKEWNQWEKQRFMNNNTKIKTEIFDPEEFKHDGFDNLEKYVDQHVPALADEVRIRRELDNFAPPRLKSINNSSYQALVIRYGILRTLIRQPDYNMEKSNLLSSTQSWQKDLLDRFSTKTYPKSDTLLHLAKAAIDYENDINDSELHLLNSYFEIYNQSCDRKHEFHSWIDFFQRLATIERFPKVRRSDKPAHATDTIEKGLWSLQEQALVYEITIPNYGHIVGIPMDYIPTIQHWLYYEMSDSNYISMLEQISSFDNRNVLNDARKTFGIETRTGNLNRKRRESFVEAGIYPSELLKEVLQKDELKELVDRYSLNAHKQKTDEMVWAIINYFEQSQKLVEDGEPLAELYLKCYEEISDGNVDNIPPQLQDAVNESDTAEKMDVLFEKATADICEEVFGLEGTKLLGQTATGIVPDGEIEQDGKWLLWDNKRRKEVFKLGSNAQAKIKTYVDTKMQQHNVKWFLIIAPEFSEKAKENAAKLEMQLGVEIRLVRATDFKELAEYWKSNFGSEGAELPLSVFYGSEELNLERVKRGLRSQFA